MYIAYNKHFEILDIKILLGYLMPQNNCTQDRFDIFPYTAECLDNKEQPSDSC